ncbi:MAG TPA: hypothetical protein VN628_12470 [Vicinamibacterales bacterium]|nr:hypothetical protein [Vicinamibacterales bacterium]
MREDVISDAVGKISSVVLELLSRGDVPTPDALRLLLRAYAATGRDDFRNALELGLARAVEIAGDSSSESAAPWLVLIGEASDASDDERLRMSASNLAFKAKMVWGATRSIGLSAASVDACLRAKLEVRDAVDELERLIGRSYEPGDGVGGSLEDEMAVAGALLTAFLVTGRLPYAMLAEELVQHTRRAHLGRADIAFAPACETASVLARMAALHHDDDYRAAAVISPAARYHEDAAVILERLAGDAPGRGLAAAAYALAAGELQSAIS